MATIRINALPEAVTPVATQNVAIDGATTQRTTIQGLVNTGAPVPSEAEARAGVDNSKRMTALRVKQSIDEEIGNTIASAAQGALAAGAMQKAQNLNDVADKASSRLNLKVPTYVADRTTLKALDSTKDIHADFDGSTWDWTAGDFSALVTLDTLEGYCIKANAIAATSGAWIRRTNYLTPRMFTAVGDGTADDRAAVQASWTVSAYLKMACLMEGLKYNCSDSVNWDNNLIVFGQGAGMYLTAWPASGGFLNNVWSSPEPETRRVVNNVYISDLVADGGKLPHPDIPTISASSPDNWLASNTAFDAAAWSKTGASVLPNVALAPDGTMTADKLVEGAVAGTHVASQTPVNAAISGENYSFAVMLKAAERTKAQISLNGAGFSSVIATVTVDLAAGTVFATSGTIKTADVRNMGDGYYHVLITRTATANGTIQAAVYTADAAGSRSYTGDGVSGIYAWNAFMYKTEEHNTNLFGGARGLSNAQFVRCTGRKIREGGGGGSGGGAFGVELGATNVVYEDCIAEDGFRGFRVNGQSGDWGSPTNALKRTIGVVVRNFIARRCGCAIFAHAVGSPTGDRNVSDLGVFDCVISEVFAENCGSYPWREFVYAGSTAVPAPTKQGVIVLAYARNMYIEKVRVKIDSTWTTTDADWLGRVGYPLGGTDYIGAGLAGNVGSIVQGHGRNIVIRDVTIDADVDTIYKCERATTFGDLASTAPTNGTGNVQQILLDNFRHVRGTHNYIFDGQSGLDNAKMGVNIKRFFSESNPVTNIVGPTGTAGLTNVRIERVFGDGSTVPGLVTEFLATGNAFASYLATSPHPTILTGSLADDTIFTVTPPNASGFMSWCIAPGGNGGASFSGRIFYNLTGSAICEDAGIPALVALGTTALTNGTGDGVDGSMNVAVVLASGTIILKNRRGSARPLQITFE